MFTLSNGHVVEYVAASGALAFDGRGWPWEWPLRWCGLLDPNCFTIVIKTLTRAPRRGNLRMYAPWRCVRVLRGGGTVNAVGLTNPGIDWWCRTIGPRVREFPWSLVGSIHSDAPEVMVEMAAMLSPFGLKALELNLSCPNTVDHLTGHAEEIRALVERVRTATTLPLWLKLGVTHDYVAIALATEGLVEAITLNSVPWRVMFPNDASPLANLGGGGVSGRLIQSHTWRAVRELAQSTTTPIIAPSVWEYDDLAKVRALGARAVSFGSIFVRYPWRPTLYVRRERANLLAAR